MGRTRILTLQEKQATMKARIARRAKRRDRHGAEVARLRAEFLARTPGFKLLSAEELLRAAHRHLHEYRPPTFLEVNAERLAAAEAKLREFEIGWDGEKYVFTPGRSA